MNRLNHLANIVLCLFPALLFSCNNAGNQPAAGGATAASKPEISRDGVHIDYTDNRPGGVVSGDTISGLPTVDTTLLFLHGWGINKTYWDTPAAHFAPKYRVVTVDLPGFGKSGHNRTSWTVEDYGKDVGTVITSLNLHNVILIGHSMSGAIIVETARQNPGQVVGLIGVDNFKHLGASYSHADSVMMAGFYNTARAHFSTTVVKFVDKMVFSPSTPPGVRERVLKDISGADSTIGIDILQRNDDYPLEANLIAVKKPFCLVNSSYIPTDTTDFIKKGISYQLYDVGPFGHYPMLEAPDTFTKLLGKAIDKIGEAR